MRDELRNGTFVSEAKASVTEFLVDEWLPAIRARFGRPRSTTTPLAMQRHVIPRIGGQQLGRGHAGDVECSVRRLARDWSVGGLDGLSPKTVKEVHTILRQALHDAVRWGRLSRNPADLVDPRRRVRRRCRCGARSSFGSSSSRSRAIGCTRCGRHHPRHVLARAACAAGRSCREDRSVDPRDALTCCPGLAHCAASIRREAHPYP